jgi:pilus assembly protein CpaF
MLQAMNTGHEGSMTTLHANSTRDALSRIETMVSMAGLELTMRSIRQQFASAIHLIVQVRRLTGGPRRVVKVSEIQGMEGETITMQDLFKYEQAGLDTQGRAKGRFVATGLRSQFLERMNHCGLKVPASMFERRVIKGDA